MMRCGLLFAGFRRWVLVCCVGVVWVAWSGGVRAESLSAESVLVEGLAAGVVVNGSACGNGCESAIYNIQDVHEWHVDGVWDREKEWREEGEVYAKKLSGLGFEDVRVKQVGDTLFLAMENRAYRGSYRGWYEALKWLEAMPDVPDNVVIVALENRIPQVRICARVAPLGAVKVDYQTQEAWRVLRGTPVENSSFGKVDWVFYPQVSLDNHRFDVIYEAIVNIAPAFEVTLWKGAQVTAQVIVPIVNNVSGEADKFRPGFMTFSQTFRLHSRWQATGVVGLFNDRRAGVRGSLEYRVNNFLTLKGRVGLTGMVGFEGNSWGLSTWERVDASLGASYFEPRSAFQLEGSLHRYVYGHYGARVDLTRHFRDCSIGVYGVVVQGGYNAGFHFAIPIRGKKAYKRKWFRPTLPDYFDWEYSVLSSDKGWRKWEVDYLKSYETVPDENRSAHYWQAEYIQRNINREIQNQSIN